MKPKIFTLFTALTLSAGALFASDTAVGGIYYDFDNANLTASVTYRGSSYYEYDDEYTGDVIIPATVTYGSRTYSVTSIGEYAFYDCSGLTSVTIPHSVESIGIWAFDDCSGLTSVVWNAKNCADFSFSPFSNIYPQITSFTFGNEVEHIPAHLCLYMENLTSVTIPNSVESIGHGAFEDCSGLTSITIPNSVTSIGNSAFDGCSGLTSVVWNAKNCADFVNGNTIVTCFDGDYPQLTSFTFGNEVQHIPAYLCYGMENLTSVTIPNSVTSIGGGAFVGCSGLTSVTIPNSVTSIGSYAFRNCSSLTSVVWNAKNCAANFSYVSEAPFVGAPITSFTFGNAVEYIPAALCCGIENLTSVTIPNSVTSIGEYAFYYCSGLTSVTIGNSVESIGNGAFEDCSGLTSITIPNSVTSIGEYVFDGCSSLPVVGNLRYADTYLVAAVDKTQSEYTIKAGTKWIGEYAFSGCSELTAISTPNSVKSIEKNTFADCTKLKTVVIGNAVTNIGDSAFYGCNRLLYFTCYAEEPPFVGADPFSTYNAYLKVPCSGLDAYKMYDVWRDFKNISCIGSEEVQVTEFNVTPSVNDAQFTWPAESGAATYELVISKDGVVFCTLTFNASGQLMGIAFAPGANTAATTATSGFQFTVTGLDEASHYTYTFDAKDADGGVIQHYAGEFNTDGFVGLEQIELAGLYTQAGRIVCEGEFRIYDLLGRDVTRLNGSLCGVYVVKTANAAQKVVVK